MIATINADEFRIIQKVCGPATSKSRSYASGIHYEFSYSGNSHAVSICDTTLVHRVFTCEVDEDFEVSIPVLKVPKIAAQVRITDDGSETRITYIDGFDAEYTAGEIYKHEKHNFPEWRRIYNPTNENRGAQATVAIGPEVLAGIAAVAKASGSDHLKLGINGATSPIYCDINAQTDGVILPLKYTLDW